MKKKGILYKPFHVILSKQMDCDNQEFFYCADDEYRVYCDICDKLCIERVFKNHLKSQTHTKNTRKHSESFK